MIWRQRAPGRCFIAPLRRVTATLRPAAWSPVGETSGLGHAWRGGGEGGGIPWVRPTAGRHRPAALLRPQASNTRVVPFPHGDVRGEIPPPGLLGAWGSEERCCACVQLGWFPVGIGGDESRVGMDPTRAAGGGRSSLQALPADGAGAVPAERPRTALPSHAWGCPRAPQLPRRLTPACRSPSGTRN